MEIAAAAAAASGDYYGSNGNHHNFGWYQSHYGHYHNSGDAAAAAAASGKPNVLGSFRTLLKLLSSSCQASRPFQNIHAQDMNAQGGTTCAVLFFLTENFCNDKLPQQIQLGPRGGTSCTIIIIINCNYYYYFMYRLWNPIRMHGAACAPACGSFMISEAGRVLALAASLKIKVCHSAD